MKITYLTFASIVLLGLTACNNANTTPSANVESQTQQSDPNPAANPANKPTTLVSFYVEDGVAIKGTDPVAYFTEGQPLPGRAEFEYEWQGATWRFASAENRDLFANNPEQYAPEYGGYCAWAVSQGYTAPIDPNAWKIVDGKLYLNFNRQIQQRWEKDIPGHIAQANQNWPQVLEE
ncbi:MAG: YHS domain-containing (seleno)protein [Coleofasciculus sp. C1-SOL-03]|jgi:YHS domain-containing protein|uniref:YHS domain-containing (seleno)protein n=1 Tax=Coleofasciculus sp. C1-SOL-03 TaxID=3069522 RepID=UPI0032FE38F4